MELVSKKIHTNKQASNQIQEKIKGWDTFGAVEYMIVTYNKVGILLGYDYDVALQKLIRMVWVVTMLTVGNYKLV